MEVFNVLFEVSCLPYLTRKIKQLNVATYIRTYVEQSLNEIRVSYKIFCLRQVGTY